MNGGDVFLFCVFPLETGEAGRPVQQLYLTGTIPVQYGGATYNIPIVIWIPSAYPMAPPAPYVAPTPNMIIKANHRHVDHQGVVYLPYIQSWSPARSNLVTLCAQMSSVFSQDPPLRSTPAGHRPPPPAAPSSSSAHSPQGRLAPPPPSGSRSRSPAPARVSVSYQPVPVGAGGTLSRASGAPAPSADAIADDEDPVEAVKRMLKKELVNKVQQAVARFNQETQADIEKLLEEQARLAGGAGPTVDDFKTELAALEESVGGLESKDKELEKWLKENEKKTDINIDEVLKPRDVLSKQFLQLTADDAAMEDVLYNYDKALSYESIELPEYLKAIRTLTREQFLNRALIRKVGEKQRSLSYAR